jgi:hypothetical protein
MSLAAIHRTKGIKEETVDSWLEKAELQVKQVEEYLVVPYKLNRIQADALWSFVGYKTEKGGTLKMMKKEYSGAQRPST